MADVQKSVAMSMRPVVVLGQGLNSAGLATGMVAGVMFGIGALALFVNWIVLLFILPSGGAFSLGALMLIFGIGFPVVWLFAAQPFAVGRAMRRFLRRNRSDVLSFIAAALEQEVGGDADPAPDRWLAAVDGVKARIDRYPRAVRPILRLGLRRSGLGRDRNRAADGLRPGAAADCQRGC